MLRGGAAVEVGHDGGLLVLADALLEEVGLALQRDELHPVEGVDGVVKLFTAERQDLYDRVDSSAKKQPGNKSKRLG